MNKKQNILLDHIVLLLLSWLVILSTIQSRWLVDWLSIPSVISKFAAVFSYFPFLALAVYKIFCDIKKLPKDVFSLLFYIFCLYYIGISVYRILTGNEFKENLYYTAILIGSVSLFSLIRNKNISVTKEKLFFDLCAFNGILICYRAIYLLVFEQQLWHSPVNEIALGAMVLLLMPFSFRKASSGSKKDLLAGGLLIFGDVLLILTLGSRAVFMVMCVLLLALLIIHFSNRKVLLTSLCAILCAIAVLAGMFAINFNKVRYNVYRETGIGSLSQFIDSISESDATEPSETESDKNSSEPGDTKPNENNSLADKAAGQIERSDKMRSNLIKASIDEIRQNPLFGTGNVLFTHKYSSKSQSIDAPAHNIFLQTLNCYGIIGLLLIAALIITMLVKIGLFHFKKFPFQQQINLLLVLAIYFGLSLVQATAYDILVMPTAFSCITALSATLETTSGTIKE